MADINLASKNGSQEHSINPSKPASGLDVGASNELDEEQEEHEEQEEQKRKQWVAYYVSWRQYDKARELLWDGIDPPPPPDDRSHPPAAVEPTWKNGSSGWVAHYRASIQPEAAKAELAAKVEQAARAEMANQKALAHARRVSLKVPTPQPTAEQLMM